MTDIIDLASKRRAKAVQEEGQRDILELDGGINECFGVEPSGHDIAIFVKDKERRYAVVLEPKVARILGLRLIEGAFLASQLESGVIDPHVPPDKG